MYKITCVCVCTRVQVPGLHHNSQDWLEVYIYTYSGTSNKDTIGDQGKCPDYRGVRYLEGEIWSSLTCDLADESLLEKCFVYSSRYAQPYRDLLNFLCVCCYGGTSLRCEVRETFCEVAGC